MLGILADQLILATVFFVSTEADKRGGGRTEGGKRGEGGEGKGGSERPSDVAWGEAGTEEEEGEEKKNNTI